MKKILKKYEYDEYIVNNSRIKKLYHMYLHQTIFDKVLDVLVLFAILFTAVEVVSYLFFNLSETVLHVFHSFTVLIFLVFGLELFREYAHSKDHKDFFKKHGVDFVLLVFLSFYFFAATYFGIARVKSIANIGKYATKAKQFKIVSRLGGLRGLI